MTLAEEILEAGLVSIAEQLERLADALENGAGGGTAYYGPKNKGKVPGFAPTRIRPSEVPGTDSLKVRALAAYQAQQERNLEYQTEAFLAILRDKFGVDTKNVTPYVPEGNTYLLVADFEGFTLAIWRDGSGSVGDVYYMKTKSAGGDDRFMVRDLADLGYQLLRDEKAKAYSAQRRMFDPTTIEVGEVGLE